MAKVIAVTDAFKTLADVQSRLGLSQAEVAGFFDEWRTDLPELSTEERDGQRPAQRAIALRCCGNDCCTTVPMATY